MSGGDDGCPNVVKDVRENKIALWSKLQTECSKGKKYSFLCPIFGYIVTSENVRGSTYS